MTKDDRRELVGTVVTIGVFVVILIVLLLLTTPARADDRPNFWKDFQAQRVTDCGCILRQVGGPNVMPAWHVIVYANYRDAKDEQDRFQRIISAYPIEVGQNDTETDRNSDAAFRKAIRDCFEWRQEARRRIRQAQKGAPK